MTDYQDILYEIKDYIATITINRPKSLKPTIARVNDYAIGAGNHLAYYCDISIAADHAVFGQNGPRVGSPASGYIVSYLANIVGHKRAREMWLLCRKYKAEEMLALSPTCLKAINQTFRDNIDHLMQGGLWDVIDCVAPDYFESGEQQEGANAFTEKRAPNFDPWR